MFCLRTIKGWGQVFLGIFFLGAPFPPYSFTPKEQPMNGLVLSISVASLSIQQKSLSLFMSHFSQFLHKIAVIATILVIK